MPDVLTQHNIAALVDLKRLADHSTATAGGAGNATTVTGTTIDRMGFTNGSMPRSALLGALWEATLSSGSTLSIGYSIQHSPDNSTWTDFQTATYAVVGTGPSGGGTVKGNFNVAVDLNAAKRYVRFNYNPSLSNSGTDTTYIDAAGVFGGFDHIPAPQL